MSRTLENANLIVSAIVAIAIVLTMVFMATATTTSTSQEVMEVDKAYYQIRRKSRSSGCRISGKVLGETVRFKKRYSRCPCQAGDQILVQINQKEGWFGIKYQNIHYIGQAPNQW